MKKTLSDRVKRLTVFNAKGGVGKTAIALHFALTFNYGVVTNDRLSIIDGVLDENRYIILEKNAPLPDFPDDWPLIFDFGGYPDDRAIEALNLSQYILVPILPSTDILQANLNFIQEVKNYKEKIIIIINQTSGGQFEEIRRVVKTYFPNLPVFNIKKSAALAWMINYKMSILELVGIYTLHARNFGMVTDQFNLIAEYILNKEQHK